MTTTTLPTPAADILRTLTGQPKTYSVSFLDSAGKCMLRAKFDKELDTSGPDAILGKYVHEVMATLGLKCIVEGRMHIGVQEALEVAQRVLENPEEPGPLTRDMYDRCMDMVSNWASTHGFPADADIWQVEYPVRTQLAEFTLTGRIDEYTIKGTHCKVLDYKSGVYVPDQEEFEKRSQTPAYCWHLLQKFPFLETFECDEHYLRNGQHRTSNLSAEEVRRLGGFLLAKCRRIKRAYETANFPATPGSHCSTCKNPQGCPLPEAKRPLSLLTDEQAADLAATLEVEEARAKESEKRLKGYLEHHPLGYVVYGDRERGFLMAHKPKPGRKLNEDRLALLAAGAGVDLAWLYDETPPKPRWSARKHKSR